MVRSEDKPNTKRFACMFRPPSAPQMILQHKSACLFVCGSNVLGDNTQRYAVYGVSVGPSHEKLIPSQ